MWTRAVRDLNFASSIQLSHARSRTSWLLKSSLSRKVNSEVLPGVWEITFAWLVVIYLPQVHRLVTSVSTMQYSRN